MTTIVVLFNLLPGADPDHYEQWAREMDMPNVRALPGCEGFQVLRVGGLLGSEERAPYEYCEIIEVSDMEAFGQAVAGEVMQAIAAQFREFADNPVFMLSDSLD